ELSVLLGVDVVRDHRDVVLAAQPLAQRIDKRRLARADRAGHTDTQRLRTRRHDRNSRLYSASCSALAIAWPGAVAASSSSARSRARSTASGISSPAAASRRCPALWPSAINRTAALVVASAHAKA